MGGLGDGESWPPARLCGFGRGGPAAPPPAGRAAQDSNRPAGRRQRRLQYQRTRLIPANARTSGSAQAAPGALRKPQPSGVSRFPQTRRACSLFDIRLFGLGERLDILKGLTPIDPAALRLLFRLLSVVSRAARSLASRRRSVCTTFHLPLHSGTMARIEHPYAWLFCAFAALGACLYGYDGVYFTGVSAMDIFIEHFGTPKADGSGYEIKAADLSVMTSMINVGELVGSLTAAPLNDWFGRKGVFLVGAVTVIIGVVLQLATDHSHGLIIGGRIILGYGVGAFSSTSPLYIGEVAPTHIRGPLLMCWQLTLSVSQIVAAAINRGTESMKTTAAYRVPMAVQLVFPLLVLLFLWWVPESPRWLLRKGKPDKCDDALRLIHHEDKTYSPQTDVAALQQDIDHEAAMAKESSWLDLVRDPIERRKVVYSAGALIAQQINGIQWFYYFGTVFSKAIGLEDPFLMTLIVFIIQVVVVFAAVLCANKIPRRPLLLITTVIMTISIFIVGCLGIPGGEVSKTFGKVIISFVIIEITAFNFAWGPLGWTIASEMAVGRNRNKIYAIAVACFWVTVWVTVFTLPYLYYSANLGPKTGFVYTGLCLVSLAYVWFCVGEVTGRTMEEINDFFMKGIPARKWAEQPRLQQSDSGSVTYEVSNEKTKTEDA